MGQGQYVADMVVPGMLHVVIVRSPVAHARIRSVNLTRAAAAPGVVYALNGADLERALGPVADEQLPLPGKWKAGVRHKILNPRQPLLCTDKVRHVGEAVAAIVAESRYAAEDAAELVELDLEELPAIVDPEAGLRPGAPVLHEKFGTNLIGEFSIGKGNAAAAIAAAPHKLKRRFHHHRYAAIPMECRGVLAQYDGRTAAMTLWSSTQVVHWVRREVAATLGLPEARVRVVAPDVGGGFGVKGHVYPEDLLIPFLARTIGRPVKWIEDRREHLLCSCHSRDQIHDVEVGFDNEGRILGYIDNFLSHSRPRNPIPPSPLSNTPPHPPAPS